MRVGLKGAGALGEPRRSKDRRPKAEDRSEPRESTHRGVSIPQRSLSILGSLT
jgi:hypothetical protein